jgi:hypothetical protein
VEWKEDREERAENGGKTRPIMDELGIGMGGGNLKEQEEVVEREEGAEEDAVVRERDAGCGKAKKVVKFI